VFTYTFKRSHILLKNVILSHPPISAIQHATKSLQILWRFISIKEEHEQYEHCFTFEENSVETLEPDWNDWLSTIPNRYSTLNTPTGRYNFISKRF
jgi:hypothetical protein